MKTMGKCFARLILVIAILLCISSLSWAAPRGTLEAHAVAAPEPAAQNSTPAHSVALTWTASTDSTTAAPGSYTVYRFAGACSATASFTALVSTSTTAYTDSSVTPGTWCYQVTFTLNGASSVPSNQASAVILPAPPTALSNSASH